MADVTKTLRDAGFMTIGLGVLAFQRAQVRRRELTRQLETQREELLRQLGGRRHELETQVTGFRSQLAERTRQFEQRFEQRFEPVVSRLEGGLDQLEGRLPDPARGVVHQARQQAAEARTQLRGALTGGASPDGSAASA
jgi:DNA anti-recombination protein RmuC